MIRQRLIFIGIAGTVLVGLLFSSIFLKRVSGKPADQSPDLSLLSDNDLKTLTICLERTRC